TAAVAITTRPRAMRTMRSGHRDAAAAPASSVSPPFLAIMGPSRSYELGRYACVVGRSERLAPRDARAAPAYTAPDARKPRRGRENTFCEQEGARRLISGRRRGVWGWLRAAARRRLRDPGWFERAFSVPCP